MTANPSKPKKKTAIKKTASLRSRAEGMLAKQKQRLRENSSGDLKKLVHELGTHQIELEMQNEELRRARIEIEASRTKYADLYDFSPMGYFTFDKKGLIKEVNQTGAGMLGKAKRSLIDKPIQDYIEHSSRAVFRGHLTEVFRTQARQTCEINLRIPHGAMFSAQLQSIVADNVKGTIAFCRTAVIDISARKRAEEALQASEKLLRLFIEHAPAALAMFDREMRYLSASRRWMSDFKLGERDLRGISHYDIFPEISKRWKAVHRRALAGEVVREDSDRFDRADGSVQWLRWAVHRWRDSAGDVGGIVIFSEDITEHKKFEETLMQTNAELAAVNRELESYSYTVSHDLRAPLRAIEGFTTAILEDYGSTLNDTTKDYFNRVISASKRMSQLIDAMLNMARLTKGEIRQKTVDLSGLVEIAAYELRKRDPDRLVEFVIAKGLKARGDRDMLNTVIENLLDNAWKFTSKHPTAKIEFGFTDINGQGAFFVRDDGAGFEMKFADKLFKPFKRLHTESEFPGLGMGLTIAYRIIERHGGRIWGEGNVEKGATLYFKL
jgi:PAS domain S-box-containing protein